MNTDRQIVADTLAYCEAHCDTEAEAEIVGWVAEHIGEAIKRSSPRFNLGEWEIAARPIHSRQLRDAILAKLELGKAPHRP